MGKSSKKDKKEDAGEAAGEERDYDELVKGVNTISKPLASKKLTKKLYKVSYSLFPSPLPFRRLLSLLTCNGGCITAFDCSVFNAHHAAS